MKKSQSAALTRRLVLFVSACNTMRVCEGNITFFLNIHLRDYER